MTRSRLEKLLSVVLALALPPARAAVNTYTFPVPRPTPGYTYTGWEAYNPNSAVLGPPPLPNPMPSLDFPIALDYTGASLANSTGIAVPGSFLGISIEMSLAEAVIGPNASWVRPQFLNLMSTLKERGGAPVLRVGGNSQEKAYLVESLESGHSSERHSIGPSSFTNTPTLVFTKGIVEAMREASNILGIQWIMGIPMNQSSPARLEIVEMAEPILGDFLHTWHLGNEPDLYVNHHYRDPGYDQTAYIREFQEIINQMHSNPNIKNPDILGGPAVCECNTNWTNHDLIANYNYLGQFGTNLKSLIVMHYPTDNCPNIDGTYPPQAEQDAEVNTQFAMFANHLSARSATNFAARYPEMAGYAKTSGKPLILLETNTASCNGFLGLSDAFVAAMWNLDLAMQLASTGWTHMMMHLGGQQAFYNPFMSPPYNSSAPFMWTVAPPMYAILVSSEFIGPNNARIQDLQINGNNAFMAGYVAYENNVPARVLLMNFMSATDGSADYTARIQIQGLSSAKARYLVAPEIHSKFNISYAGQSWGGYFESDGVLRGEQTTVNIDCPNSICSVKVPAPGVAVVFLNGDLVFDANVDPIETYATTHTTKMKNTAAVDGLTLATSNGIAEKDRNAMLGMRTSAGKGQSSSATRVAAMGASIALAASVGCLLMMF